MLKLESRKNLQLSVVVTGLPRCKHELNLRSKGASEPIFSVTDVNFDDTNPRDVDPKFNVDVYPIGNAIKGKTGVIVFDWTIVIAKVELNAPYKVIVSLVQDSVPLFSEAYSNTDTNAGTGRVRVEMGIEIFEIIA